MAHSGHAPHGSVRAELPHTAPALGLTISGRNNLLVVRYSEKRPIPGAATGRTLTVLRSLSRSPFLHGLRHRSFGRDTRARVAPASQVL
jgi:hypothetical protein